MVRQFAQLPAMRHQGGWCPGFVAREHSAIVPLGGESMGACSQGHDKRQAEPVSLLFLKFSGGIVFMAYEQFAAWFRAMN